MTGSALVHREAAASSEMLEPAAFRAAVVARVRAGQRPVTLYGRPEPGSSRVVVTAVLQEGPALRVCRTVVEPATGFHALTADVPAFHAFERELHEQHGVRLAGHPWLKPIRYEGCDQSAMDGYPWYRVDGKEVHEVAVGPIHAGVIEPGAFRFACFGEQVLHLEIQLGYQHRGVEAELRARDPRRLAPYLETVAGDSSAAHAWAYCGALESLAGHAVAAEIDVARAVLLELERVAMHLASLSGLATDVGFIPGASGYGRLRTTAINLTQRLCGSRFARGAMRPCSSGVRLDPELAALARAAVAELRHDVAIIDACMRDSRTVRHRLVGTGVVSAALAAEIGLVGTAARSSGVALDARSPRRGAYAAPALTICTETDGDCWARGHLRMTEIDASLTWLAAVLAEPRAWEPSRAEVPALAPAQLAIAVVEGWRGEVVHALETDATGALLHYKVQDPSLRNWLGLALAVRGNEISDFPICNKSFDLSYCGNDL